MPTILEISDDLLALADLMEENAGADGEIPPEAAVAIEAWFAELSKDRDRKLDNYGALVREKQLRAAARKEELERLQIRVRVDENQVKFLKNRLLLFLDLQKVAKVETARYKFSCRGNGGVQALKLPDDPKTLPEDLQRIEVLPDTEKIREALKAGREIEGVALLPRGRHLQIN